MGNIVMGNGHGPSRPPYLGHRTYVCVCYTISINKFVTTPQYPPVHVRCTHQNMPIVITPSPELRVSMPTVGDMGIVYIHCDGEQLKLSDSDRGSNTEYTATSYYEWPAGSDGRLLFIFPTRVSLTTITCTLHYYSDSVRGRPRLRFYAVPDDFDVWDALTSGNRYVGVASARPGGEPAGPRNVRITLNFNTKKVLMYKHSSSFQFAVSEVEFFTSKHRQV